MAIPTRWRKIIKDMWSHRSRSILVILSIAVGVAAVGMINNAGLIIQRDLYSEYLAGNPALLHIFVSPFEKELMSAVEGMREVEYAQARRVIGATLFTPNGFEGDIELNAIADFEDVQVSRFTVQSGSSSPGLREIFLEGQSAEGLGLGVGDSIQVKLAGERKFDLTIAGIVHDVYVMPYSLMGQATGYISMSTLQWMGEPPKNNRLDIVVAGASRGKEYVLEIGNLARDRVIEPSGFKVGRIQIPGIGSEPGEHWAHNQIKGFLLILQVMGVMAMFLSGGLVINTISAILTQQVKQIGILRSVGAVRRQIIGMYLVNVLVFSVFGLVVAIPLGLVGAWWLANFAANFLNFTITRVDLPLHVFVLQVALGLLVPLGVAVIPIFSGTRISVYDAIYQFGLSNRNEGGIFEGILSRLRRFSPKVMLSLRNTFRRKARLAFTLSTLTLAGAMFIASFSTHASLTSQINQVRRYLAFDASLTIPGGANKRTVEREALRISGVKVAEGWSRATGVLVDSRGSESEEFDVVGLPFDSITLDPLLLQGTWLNGPGRYQVVVNEDFYDIEPGLAVGQTLIIKIGGRKQTYEVLGIVSKHLSGPRIYMDETTFGKLTGKFNQVDLVRVRSKQEGLSSPVEQDRFAEQLEERFKNAGLSNSSSSTEHAFFGDFTEVFDIILIVLTIMAGLLAIVGGLGLTGALGINVLERTREIGVLRAVGAANRAVLQVVVVEGVVVALISWVMGGVLSIPSSWALSDAVVRSVFEAEPSFQYSLIGLFIWLGIVLLIGVVSSIAPARNAALLRVRDVLDYE